MKKYTLLFMFLLLISILYSPNKIIAVSPSKMNVIYVGVDNPIDAAVFGEQEKDITVTVSEGTIKKTAPGKYIVNVTVTGSVSVILKKGGKEIGRRAFKCKRLPDPIARIGNLTIKPGGSILKSAVLSQQTIGAYMNFEFSVKYTVVSFSVSTIIKGFPKTAYSNSNQFTTKQKKLISGAHKDERIYIDDIKAKGPDGKVRQLNPLVFKVK